MFWNKMAEDDPRLWDSPVAWEKGLANGEKTKENHPIVVSNFQLILCCRLIFGGCLNGLQEGQASSNGLTESQSMACRKTKLQAVA